MGSESYNINDEVDPQTEYGCEYDSSKRLNSSQMSKPYEDKVVKEEDTTIFSKTYQSRDELEPIKS